MKCKSCKKCGQFIGKDNHKCPEISPALGTKRTKEQRINLGLAKLGKPQYQNRRKDVDRNKKEIKDLYIIKEKGLKEIAKLMKCDYCVIKRILLEDKIIIRPQKFYLKGKTAWNNGLTKETNEGIMRNSESLKKGYKEGKIKNWNSGLTKETDKRVKKNAKNIKLSYKGRKTWCEGLTKETDKRLMKMSSNSKGKHKSPETEFIKHDPNNQIRKARKRVSPNKPERIMINLIQQNNLNFIYVGDGKKFIKGENSSFNPDFLSKNQKYIIEVFGDYWHNLSDHKKRDKERLKTYSKEGYKTLIIWQHELKKPNKVVNKIQEFIK